MARPSDGNEQLLCSFCGKSQRQVKKLIAGPGVYICDECIDLCNEIIDEELTTPSALDLDNLPRPKEIYTQLNDYVVSQEEAKRTLSVACPWKPPHTWWIRIFAFGSAIRFPFAPPARRSAPMLMAMPTQIVCTSGLMNCIVS